MLNWLLGLNIVGPFIAALLCFLIKNHKVRAAVVMITAAELVVTSLMLLARGPFSYNPETLLGLDIGEIILVGEMALLLFILYVSFKLRNIWVGLLTLIQLVGAVYFDFFMAHGVETSPAFYVDELSLVLNLLVSIVGSLICVFAIPYMNEYEHHLHLEKTRQPRFFFFLVLFLGAMNGLALVNNLAWLYFFWEITTLCSFMLIGHDGTEIAIKNATRAILLNMIGGVGFLAGIITVFSLEHTLSIQEIIKNGVPAPAVLLPFAFLCFAGFTKSAQVPFQSWLLGAMVAPTPVSALLHSSTMVKAGVYLVLRLAPAFVGTTLSTFVALFGAFTFVATSALAISQSNGKRILAYSTIANLGLIICCAGINTPLAMAAGILLMIFHGVSKGLLFLCVGTIEHGIGSRDLEDMHGLINKMPVTAGIAVLGMITMLLPPFGMFIGKWSTLEAAPSLPLVMLLLVLGSALTIVFWLRWTGNLLSTSYNPEKTMRAEEQSPLIRVPLGLLAAGAVVLSFCVNFINRDMTLPFIASYYPEAGLTVSGMGTYFMGAGAFPLWAVFGTLAAALIVGGFAASRAKTASASPNYFCGENSGETEFLSCLDSAVQSHSSNYYLDAYFGEGKLTVPSNIIAVIILIALFGVSVI